LKLSFLFGSGISIPAGMPTMNEITESLLLGKDIKDGIEFYKHTDSHYYKKPYNSFDPVNDVNMVSNISKFLARIKPEIDYFLGIRDIGRCANYEDMYFVVSQFDHYYNTQGMNPAIQSFIDKISNDTKYLMKQDFSEENYSLTEFSREVINYINDIAISFLNKAIITTQYLAFLLDIYNETEVERMDLFTLNHDLVLEKFFSLNSIFLNNFMENSDDCRIKTWNDQKQLEKINLLKLHGSIDWFPINGIKGMPVSEYTILEEMFNNHRPLVLMGTVNKILQYSSDIWIDLQWMFKIMLAESDVLIVSGYGFGDDMVNSRIMSWLKSKNERKIIIIHAEPEQLKNGSLSMLFDELGWSVWTELRKQKKIIVLRKWIQDVTWYEIKEIIKEHKCQNKNLN